MEEKGPLPQIPLKQEVGGTLASISSSSNLLLEPLDGQNYLVFGLQGKYNLCTKPEEWIVSH